MLLLIILLNGCTRLHLTEYEAQPFDYYAYSQVKDGLAVAINPFTDEKKVIKSFGADLLSVDIFPVFVVVENRTSSSSFILSREGFSVRGTGVRPRDDLGRFDLIFDLIDDLKDWPRSVTFMPIPRNHEALIPATIKSKADIRMIQQNFVTKELQSKELPPGNVTNGFVYFHAPIQYYVSDRWIIHLEITDMRSKESIIFDIPFEL